MKDNKPLKRSSLKMSSNFTQEDILAIQQKNKRNSVNWASSLVGVNLNFKEMKTSFGIIEEEKDSDTKTKAKELNVKFESARRESIKNEFTNVKKIMKDFNIDSIETEEEEEEEETKKNTEMNKEVGKRDSVGTYSDDDSKSDNEAEG